MAVTATGTRPWQHLNLKISADTATGDRTVTSLDGTKTYSTSSGQTGTCSNPSTDMLNDYNNAQRARGLPQVTSADFNRIWQTQGTDIPNQVAASYLNDISNYSCNAAAIAADNAQMCSEALNNRARFFDNRIPGVIHPLTDQRVNNDQTITQHDTVANVTAADLSNNSTQGISNSGTLAAANTASVGRSLNDRGGPDGGADGTFGTGMTGYYATSRYMRYPEQRLSQLGYDYIQITAKEYVAGGLSPSNAANNYAGSDTRNRFGNEVFTVQLPMQPNLAEANAVSWGGDKLNELQRMGAGVAEGAIEGLAGIDPGKIAAAAGDLFSGAGDVIKDPKTAKFLAAYFAGQAVGANVTARATGTVINPNLELLFEGPTLRTFSFNFTFTPRDESEARGIRRIIKSFKKSMLPKRSPSNLFLITPNIYELEYIYNGSGQHPFLNKFKPCAMTSFNVNYTPGGSYSTYNNGSLTQYGVEMAFGELEPNYEDQIDPVDSRSMGY